MYLARSGGLRIELVTRPLCATQPKIDLSCVRDIRIPAGEDFSVNINYTAFPKPTAQFWNEDVELGSDSRVHIQVTEEFVSIIVKKAVRSDAGQYRLRLTNDAGYDTATFNVTVLDRYSNNLTLHTSITLQSLMDSKLNLDALITVRNGIPSQKS